MGGYMEFSTKEDAEKAMELLRVAKADHDPRIKELADRLISTLDTMMDSEKADAIVRDVATELYNFDLGIKGKIVVDTSQATGLMHGGFGRNGRRAVQPIAKYKFEPEANNETGR